MHPDYLLDIPYTSFFYENLNPWLLRYISVIHGFAPSRLENGFNYCELGCGHGLSLNVLAASNPEARFFGVDLNPDHIQTAEKLARAGELGNITFLEENFARLFDRDLPEFDFITLHGVFSWISPAMRHNVSSFIERRIKPGGLVMVSYNTPQGWAVTAPLRDFLRSFIESGSGDVMEKARQGLEELRFLRDSGAGYFKFNPLASTVLDSYFQLDLRYIVHEFLTPFWQPLYFSEVLEQMKHGGLEFVGSYPVLSNYGEMMLPKELHEYFKKLPNRVTFEMRKDFINMTLFRSDVFRKPSVSATAKTATTYDDLVFGTTLLPDKIPFFIPTPFNEVVNLEGELFKKAVEVVAGGSLSAAEIFAHPALASFLPNQLRQALDWLAAGGQIKPYARPYCQTSEGNGSPLQLSKFNKALLSESLADKPAMALASWTAGSAVVMDRLDALALWAVTEAGLEQAEAWAGLWLVRNNAAILSDSGITLAERIKGVAMRMDYCRRQGLDDPPNDL